MTTSKLTRSPTDHGYSVAVVVPAGTRSLVFLSGQIGVDETGKIAPGGFEAEARQCFANLQATLERAGGTLEDVVRITFFLKDLADYSVYAKVRAEFFPVEQPTGTGIGISLLALGARVELEATAAIRT
jgi:2-iminobutanoate/2-iminopropanoate deaminase